MTMRPTKEQAKELILNNSAEYIELFLEFRADAHGWLLLPKYLINAINNLGIQGYVTLYKDQNTIEKCLMLAILGNDGMKALSDRASELNRLNDPKLIEDFYQELFQAGEEMTSDLQASLSKFSPNDLSFNDELESLDDASKNEQLLRARLFWIHILLAMHNLFSVMVHGESMVSLVPKALAGDDVALLKAIKIDRNLATHHPYFIERINKAKIENDTEFLQGLAKYQSTPNLESRIRLPGVYIVFAMLELVNWLHEFTHEEILDLCDAAKLDRWQHKIEDVNAITKCLRTYRLYQQSGGVSMH